MAFAKASMFTPMISPALNDTGDHPVNVVDLTALPLLNAGFVPMIVLATVGSVVPVATLQTSMVVVGLVPVATIDQPVIVTAYSMTV